MQSYNRLSEQERSALNIFLNGEPTSALIGMRFTVAYTVKETVDDRGRTGDLIGVFFSAEEADKAAKGKGWYGGQGEVRERAVLMDESGSVYILESAAPITPGVNLPEEHKAKVRAALDKLTPEDRALLGIKVSV